MRRVNFLGLTISADEILPNLSKIQAVAIMKPPKSKEEVRRFLGMVSYYRKFVRDFGKTSSCLCQLKGKDASFTWTEEHNTAFEKLKIDLTRALISIYQDFKQPFEIFTDASMRAIGRLDTRERRY